MSNFEILVNLATKKKDYKLILQKIVMFELEFFFQMKNQLKPKVDLFQLSPVDNFFYQKLEIQMVLDEILFYQQLVMVQHF